MHTLFLSIKKSIQDVFVSRCQLQWYVSIEDDNRSRPVGISIQYGTTTKNNHNKIDGEREK
jgi:hypothetical protein